MPSCTPTDVLREDSLDSPGLHNRQRMVPLIIADDHAVDLDGAVGRQGAREIVITH